MLLLPVLLPLSVPSSFPGLEMVSGSIGDEVGSASGWATYRTGGALPLVHNRQGHSVPSLPSLPLVEAGNEQICGLTA